MRLAGRDPEALKAQLPALCSFHRVLAAGELNDAARVHFILHRLIPDYLARLPAGRDCQAIRELMTWEDSDGDARSLTTRYHKASAHLLNAADDFGRRQEPRLLLECARRFAALDHEDRLQAATADSGMPAAEVIRALEPREEAPSAPIPAEDPAAGVLGVHQSLDNRLFADYISTAERIMILNTWIPEVGILADALVEALARGTDIRILMLYPYSHIARLRSEALHGPGQGAPRDLVRPGVKHCLDVLAAIAGMVDEGQRRCLRVRLYHSLPSIAVYSVDDRAFMSVFLHGQISFKAPAIEVQGQESLLGRPIFRELETLWEIGQEFGDLIRWQDEIEDMAPRFRVPVDGYGDLSVER